ncbi:MAG TPA: cyclase family protein [Bryobacteraceae bacterium]|nr:cyclase family protein [Bryobacteraceae bacterium]
MSSDWIDISVPLHNGMVQWPDDVPFERIETLKLSSGDECNLSEMRASLHTGTHMDAPSHYLEGAAGMEAMPIAAGIGRARVIAIRDPELIRIDEIEPHRPAKGERLLFKTRNSSESWKTAEFQKRFVYIPPDTAHYLTRCGVQTVGVDYLSVGAYESGGAETHRILLSAGIWIIEGLQLEHVEPGEYELFCLPLKIVGGDGAPARALLRKLTL